MKLKDGTEPRDPRLGRVEEFDEASRGYQVRGLLESRWRARGERDPREVRIGPTLDQGQTSGCTGWAAAHNLNASPHDRRLETRWPFLDKRALRFYYGAQRRDQWEGGEYPGAEPRYGGSSVLGVSKDLRRRGLISGFHWVGAGSGDVEGDIVDTLLYEASIEHGLKWFESCYDVSPGGVIVPDPSLGDAGGHAITSVAVAFDFAPRGHAKGTWVAMQQTWGLTEGVAHFGQPGGILWVLLSDLVEWMENHRGEGAVFVG